MLDFWLSIHKAQDIYYLAFYRKNLLILVSIQQVRK